MPTSAVAAIATEFDGKAGVYERNRLAPWYRAQAEFLLEHLRPLGADEVVIDVGCGTGYLLRRLAATRPGGRAIGIDVSGEMVRVARAKAASDGLTFLTFVQADWEDPAARIRALAETPAPSRIVCASTLHYFADPEAALAAMHAVLRPGGEVLILERATEHSPLTRLWDRLHRHVIRDHVQFHSSTRLIDMMSAAGFVSAEIRARLSKRLWKGKLYTSLALIGGLKDGPAGDAPVVPCRSR